MQDQPVVSYILVKDSTAGAIYLKTKDPVKQKEYANKLINVADDAIAAVNGGATLSQASLSDLLQSQLAKQDMDFFVKLILSDVIIVLDQIYPTTAPDIEIPEQYRADVVKVFEFMKKGAELFQ